jgi:hypothetical protein
VLGGYWFFFSFWRTAGPGLHQISFNKNLVLYIFILFFYAGPGYNFFFLNYIDFHKAGSHKFDKCRLSLASSHKPVMTFFLNSKF